MFPKCRYPVNFSLKYRESLKSFTQNSHIPTTLAVISFNPALLLGSYFFNILKLKQVKKMAALNANVDLHATNSKNLYQNKKNYLQAEELKLP